MKKTRDSSPLPGRIRIRHGRLTIPAPVRKAANLPEDASFVVESIGGGFLLLPEATGPHLPGDEPGDVTLADVLRRADASGRERIRAFHQAGEGFRAEVKAAGMTTQDLLEGLDAQGDRYTREVYGQ